MNTDTFAKHAIRSRVEAPHFGIAQTIADLDVDRDPDSEITADDLRTAATLWNPPQHAA